MPAPETLSILAQKMQITRTEAQIVFDLASHIKHTTIAHTKRTIEAAPKHLHTAIATQTAFELLIVQCRLLRLIDYPLEGVIDMIRGLMAEPEESSL